MNITDTDWTGTGTYYIAVGKKDAPPEYATSLKVDINSGETTLVAAKFESPDDSGEALGGSDEDDDSFLPGSNEESHPAGTFFGSFAGEKTINELLQVFAEKAGMPSGITITYELFKAFGGAIYLGPNQTNEVTGSTRVTAGTLLYVTIPSGFGPGDEDDNNNNDDIDTDTPFIPGIDLGDGNETSLPANMLFGSFAGEKTINELLQGLAEKENIPGVTITYELFKAFGGAIYLGPNQTNEVAGSTRVTADTLLYITIPSGFGPGDEIFFPANMLFGPFAGEKTINELLQGLVIKEDIPGITIITYEFFKVVGGAIYLGPNQTNEVTGSTRVTADTLLYITIPSGFGPGGNDTPFIPGSEEPFPADKFFGPFDGQKTIDELLQMASEHESMTLTYDLVKLFGGAIYLGPNKTNEVTGSTKVSANTPLYVTVPADPEQPVGPGGDNDNGGNDDSIPEPGNDSGDEDDYIDTDTPLPSPPVPLPGTPLGGKRR
jgi:hypothetical protein